MSRIGKMPISLPPDVSVIIEGSHVIVKGKLGQLSLDVAPLVKVVLTDNQLTVERTSDSKTARSLHGLTRSLVNNMVLGVANGFQRTLDMVGVGYRAQVKGTKLVISAGYSHPVEFEAPAGIQFQVNNETEIVITGIDKQLVGEYAARIRKVRKPEPYKGKGIKYREEVIRRKQGKTA